MFILVPTVKTSFSRKELVSSLIKFWEKQYNSYPEKKNIGVIIAQWAIETGSGSYCWNWNIGNTTIFGIESQRRAMGCNR
jgi:hypothetical protein